MASAIEVPSRATEVQQIGGFPVFLRRLVDRYVGLWQESGESLPELSRSFDRARQNANRAKIDRLIAFLSHEFDHCPHSPENSGIWEARILRAVKNGCRDILCLTEAYAETIFSRAFVDATRSFIRQAKEFDPAIDAASLSQALRNVWVMNFIQILLRESPAITPSVLAYSLLYPYTDNFLDDPAVGRPAKESLINRLGLRLSGCDPQPATRLEGSIFRLLDMIEEEYPRAEYPEVYLSLQAIHQGQIQSLSQQGARPPSDVENILRISIEKGGTSVMADAWLVAGRLTLEEADFFFGFGVLLQLLDDLQDLEADRGSGRWSVFGSAAGDIPIDALACRLHGLIGSVLGYRDCFEPARYRLWKELIFCNCELLLLGAIGRGHRYFSAPFLRHMQRFSPIRFNALDALEDSARPMLDRARQSPVLDRLLACIHGMEKV